MEPNVFDQIANQYDTEERIQLARHILAKLEPVLLEISNKTLLDFGCGTGLLGIPLTSLYKEVILSDGSKVMLDVVDSKIKAKEIQNAKTIAPNDLAKSGALPVDHILMSLVLLHIPNTKQILETIHSYLKPGGTLYLIDFDENKKVSHPKVHSGFKQIALMELLKEVGFQTVSSSIILEEKKVFMNEDASLFLMVAERE
ncbi:Methylase/methyltransferase [Leptospira biflexa serovar Patoc strain 'Patoc 1 (Ames)']|uniref:Putative S-adenosyl-L-methionine-dependent methyltransferase n=1 Tax=Leptospira biflexa serovar Patoc (strain Patoc 1 / ATCC 23582 / Paris) TaxID=456481 RepID=B0SQ51_LEPBP|nr:class I SAM-dependent methyltransferase [Leptospira biflexa]ABZ95498.1 Methylase/methyltransferase [Leptospira biflexa serovar Patoc strain 'Patoc 1 (Ames)']ABZ99203.1 Putative S-adenosyl-L-methionine-dependent methyltransferase [Leptospira biflexa serovar Patoc strain 'Patoc 1 (Paris)']